MRSLFCLMSITTICLVSCSLIQERNTHDNMSLNCYPQDKDPHQCVHAVQKQECYRHGNITKCNAIGWACQLDCCDGWAFDKEALCTIPTKPKVCKSPIDVTKGDIKFCQDDSDCNKGGNCCSNVCTRGYRLDECLYENEFHTVGETMTGTNDVCSSCICFDNGGSNVTMTCSKSNCSWAQNETDIPSNYKPPEVYNAPQKGQGISVYVSSTRNIAFLSTINWTAVDFEGNHLNFNLSKQWFHHCLCNNSKEMVYLKTDPDRYDNYYENIFPVNIIDKFKPIIKRCPHNQTVTYKDRIVWEAPIITDNVGVRKLIVPKINSNTKLPPGHYKFFYKAIDWSNNVAYCNFSIVVDKVFVNNSPAPTQLIVGKYWLMILIGLFKPSLHIIM